MLSPEEIARRRARPFPVMPDVGSLAQRWSADAGRALNSVPWHVADRAWRTYDARFQCGQTVEELAARGGFSVGELNSFYPGWREAADASAREILDHVQALAAHPDPAAAIVAIREALTAWR